MQNENTAAQELDNARATESAAALEEKSFAANLSAIKRGGAMYWKALRAAFTASVNAVLFRADTARLVRLMDVLDGDTNAPIIRRAAIRYAGGLTRNDKGDFVDAAASVLAYSKRTGWLLNGDAAARERARVFYLEHLQGVAVDCLVVKNPTKELNARAELVKMGKRFQRAKTKDKLMHEFINWCNSTGLLSD